MPAGLLFVPFFIEIDSTTGVYRVRLSRLASIQIFFFENEPIMKMRIGWWSWNYHLMKIKKKKYTEHLSRISRKNNSFSFQKSLNRIERIARSFHVRECYIMLDTMDMPLNGMLYPWFYLISRMTGKTVLINFWGENTVILRIENSASNILWRFLRS